MATPLYDADKYTYRVLWSEDEQRYVGVCTEFPVIRHLAGSHDEALTGVVDRVRDALADLYRTGQDPPTPAAVRALGGWDK